MLSRWSIRHPRSDFLQDGAVARAAVAAVIPWMSAITAQGQTFATQKRKQRHGGYLTEPQQTPWAFTTPTAQIQQRWPAIDSWARAVRTGKRPPGDVRRLTEPQQTPWAFVTPAANIPLFRPAIEEWERSGQTRRRRPADPRFLTEPQAAPWIFAAVPTFNVAFSAAFELLWARPRTRGRLFPSTSPADSWIFSGIPAGAFDASLWAALEVFSQRMTYRTGRQPHDTAGRAPEAAAFDPALSPAFDLLAQMMGHRRRPWPLTPAQDFAWTLEEATVWPAVLPMFERMLARRRGRLADPFDPGWLFTSIPSAFDPALWPALDVFAQRPSRRGRLFPSTDPDLGWLFSNLPPAFDPALWAAFELFASRTRRRPRGFLDVPVDLGWLKDAVTFHPEFMAALELLAQRMARRRDHDARIILPDDGWIFTAVPPVIPGTASDYIPTWRPRRR